jgi:hypothetical protein
MRQSVRFLSVAGVAAVALAGCGSKSAGNVLSGKSPGDIVKASAAAAKQSSMRFELSATVGFDTSKLSGLSAGELGQLGKVAGNGLTLDGRGDIESAQRFQMTLNAKPLSDKPITVVAYDGKGYISVDSTHFYEGDLSGLTSGVQIDPSQITGFLDGVGTVSDKGPAAQDGLQVEHFQATLDQGQLEKLISKQLGTSSDSTGLGQLLLQFLTFQGATVDDYVDSATGRIDRLGVRFGITVDFDKLTQAFGALGAGGGGSASSQIPHGQLTVNLDSSVHLYDYGAKISVQKPTVDANAPKLNGGGGGLFGLT